MRQPLRKFLVPCAFAIGSTIAPATFTLHAQGEKVYTSKDAGVLPPKLTHRVEAQYTEDARARGVAGNVTLSLEIDKTGKARNIKVLEGLEPGLDKSAIDALNRWHWEPGTKDGNPVIFAAKVTVSFHLQ
jgi:TonB family protein